MLIDVSVSLTWRFLWVALNSLTSFCARVLDTVRAQNWTVPVALTPNVLDAFAAVVDVLEDAQPAAATASSAAAVIEKTGIKEAGRLRLVLVGKFI